jgi:hypothetical protein
MKRLVQPNLQSFLETASVFENTGSGLYHGGLLNIEQIQDLNVPLFTRWADGPITTRGIPPI